MHSDFETARFHLKCARDALSGVDRASRIASETLNALIIETSTASITGMEPVSLGSPATEGKKPAADL